MKKLVLIDGHSILNRAFYGVPDLSNAKGLHTNAIYGFLNIMFKILEEEKPEYLIVAFDVSAPTFRHKMYQEYKGTRKSMPEELREQVPVMKDVLNAMGITIVEKAGYEADDILGTLAKQAQKGGLEVSLVSGDRDLLQIADEHIKVRIPKTKGGKTEIEDYYEKDVKERYQVTPKQFIDVKALMGDSSDNIPGVPKVGEKTATNLIVTYDSLEGIYAHIDEITKKAIKESLLENRNLADLSKELATICIDCDLGISYEDAALQDFYTPEAYELFKKLEFKNMLSRFSQTAVASNNQKKSFVKINEKGKAADFFSSMKKQLTDDSGGQKPIVGVCIWEDEDGFAGVTLAVENDMVSYIQADERMDKEYLMKEISGLLPYVCLSFFDIKKQYRYFSSEEISLLEKSICESAITDYVYDILIAAYLINPLKSDIMIEDIANEYLEISMSGKAELFGKKSYMVSLKEKPEEFFEFACLGAYVCGQAAKVLRDKLKAMDMDNLMDRIEMPLSYVLYTMEQEGIAVLPDELKSYGKELEGHISVLEESIYRDAGMEFNLNSPKQLGEVLFDKLKLPNGKKTKTGYSTAADVLEKLAPEYEIVRNILEYRTYAKLKSTYAEGLYTYIGEDNRIHTNFMQTITATGRLSSTEPNLQNIPMRMELGRRIRKVFVPKEGYVFADADYSQIELRILAHMSDDKQLIEAYEMEEDIHKITASKVFHTPLDEVTSLQRRNAKAVNFGIVYGISSFGLSQDLSISTKEAAEYIEQYFATYPDVKKFLDYTVELAKGKGYAETLYKRRRPVPELSSGNYMQRSFGERIAMNSPIQGTAADIIKIAMVKVWKRLYEEKLRSRLILQIHDELLVETAKEEEEQVSRILIEEMQNAAKLKVTLEVDLHIGENWYEAK